MKDNQLQFISSLSLYTWRSTLLRIFMVGAVAFSFLFFASRITNDDVIEISVGYYIKVALVFIIVSESNVALDHISERLFPIPEKIRIRVLMHFFISLLLTFLAFMYFEKLVGLEDLLKERIVRLMLALGIIFIFILVFFAIGVRIVDKWMISRSELEEIKQAKLKSDYNTLQEQLNPHFLFNNLSVLKSLIMYDPKVALEFVQNFTDVYRYVLQSREKTTVKLKEELEFMESYIGIHKERLGSSLNVKISVSRGTEEKNLPPLTLQLLVENAIKHNVAGKNNPLNIEIMAEDLVLEVKNNKQIKDTGYSTQSGLKNLIKRYEMIIDRKVIILDEKDIFLVKVPLL